MPTCVNVFSTGLRLTLNSSYVPRYLWYYVIPERFSLKCKNMEFIFSLSNEMKIFLELLQATLVFLPFSQLLPLSNSFMLDFDLKNGCLKKCYYENDANSAYQQS